MPKIRPEKIKTSPETGSSRFSNAILIICGDIMP